jgi:hypothetical protein
VILKDGALRKVEGTLGEPDAAGKTVPFKREGVDAVPVQVDRLQAMIFYRTETPPEPSIAKVFDAEGSVLAAARIGYKKGGWTIRTPFGTELPLADGAVAKLDFNLGKLTYLSDLEPSKAPNVNQWGDKVDPLFRYTRDAGPDRQPLMLTDRYAKGLWIHSRTELTYDLGGKYKELRGVLGIDPRYGLTSAPIVEIFCDGEKRFSQTISAKETQKVNIDVKDVATLRILVRSADDVAEAIGFGAQVTFADVRVSQ